jgi:heme-degrading monooxygenase HmoA
MPYIAKSYIAKTPKPPYYAVVFTSINADVDHTEHTKMYQRMVEIAESYEGYIGIEPARNADGSGVAVIYWKDLATIQAFARHPEHIVAKKKGREIWYTHYLIRVCKVERDYGRPEESESMSSPAQSSGVDASCHRLGDRPSGQGFGGDCVGSGATPMKMGRGRFRHEHALDARRSPTIRPA